MQWFQNTEMRTSTLILRVCLPFSISFRISLEYQSEAFLRRNASQHLFPVRSSGWNMCVIMLFGTGTTLPLFYSIIFCLNQSIALCRRLQLKAILCHSVITDFSWFSEHKEWSLLVKSPLPFLHWTYSCWYLCHIKSFWKQKLWMTPLFYSLINQLHG